VTPDTGKWQSLLTCLYLIRPAEIQMKNHIMFSGCICIALLVSACGKPAEDTIVVNYDAEIAALKAQVSNLETRASRASDYIDIANLQAIYGYYVDKKQMQQAADLFARNASLEIAGRGVFEGQDRIREYLLTRGELTYGTLYNRMQLQPVIHIADDGMSAKARWRSFIQVGHLGEEARWGEATYNNEYVKEDDVWKISKLHSFITFYVDYETGWNKAGVALPPQLDDITPDGEQSVQYGAFPEVFVPPYHYPNPVTGE
jgi:hypothetical protein